MSRHLVSSVGSNTLFHKPGGRCLAGRGHLNSTRNNAMLHRAVLEPFATRRATSRRIRCASPVVDG